MALKQIGRKVRRHVTRGDRTGGVPKRLASHSRPLKSIIENRERYANENGLALFDDEVDKWHG